MCQLLETGEPQLDRKLKNLFLLTLIRNVVGYSLKWMQARSSLGILVFLFALQNPSVRWIQCLSVAFFLGEGESASHPLISTVDLRVHFGLSPGYCIFPGCGFQDVATFRDGTLLNGLVSTTIMVL